MDSIPSSYGHTSKGFVKQLDSEYKKFTPDMSTWKGRQRKGEKCVNSFATFVATAKRSNEGREHLKRHHGGYGL